VAKNCTDANAIDFGDAGCEAMCAKWNEGEEGDTSGDSVQCRIYHAGALAAADPAVHCPHASPGGGGVCVDAEPAGKTYTKDAQPIYQQYCKGCHFNSPGSGGHNIAADYSDASKPAKHVSCSGKMVGECTIIRIKAGHMPPFGAGPSGAEMAILQEWVDGGMKQ